MGSFNVCECFAYWIILESIYVLEMLPGSSDFFFLWVFFKHAGTSNEFLLNVLQ